MKALEGGTDRHSRLPVAALVVVMAVGVFGAGQIIDRRAAQAAAVSAGRAMDVVESAAILVHDLQLERGLSALYTVEPSEGSHESLLAHRESTDESLSGFRVSATRADADLSVGSQVAVADARAGLDRMDSYRAFVDNGSIEVSDTLDYYTRIIASLLDLEEGATPGGDADARRDAASSLRGLARAKETAGLERAVIAEVVAERSLGPATLPKVVDLVGRQSQLLSDSQRAVPNELRSMFEERLTSPDVVESVALRDRILTLDLDGITPGGWFEAATRRVEVLRELEVELLSYLERSLVAEHGDSDQGRVFWWVLLAVMAGIGVLTMTRIHVRWRRHLIGAGVIVGIAGSILMAVFFRSMLQHDSEIEQARAAGDALALIGDAFDEYVDVTKALAQVVAANPSLSEQEFIEAAATLLDPVYRPGVSDLNWLTVVEPDQVTGFVAAKRAADWPDFEITPPSDEQAVVITYRYSSADNRPANYGLDVRSIPTAREAVDTAAATGSAVLTDVFPISGDGREEGAVIVYVPAYRDGHLVGFANAVIMGGQFIDGIRGLSSDLAVDVVDVNSDRRVTIAGTHPDHEFSAGTVENTVTSLGQTWGIRVESLAPPSPVQTWLPIVVLTAGLLSTAMLAVAASQGRNGRIRAEALAEKRTVDLRRASADLSTLNEIGRAISATLDAETVLDLIVQHAVRLVEADACALFLVDHESESIIQRLGAGIDSEELEGHTYAELAEGMSGYVWKTGAAICSHDIAIDPRNTGVAAQRAHGRSGVSLIVAPIVEAGRTIGTLSALSYDRRRPLTDVDKNSIDLLAAQASVAIRNAHMYARVVSTNEDLRVAQSARDEFVANISHEFRTPLTVIAGATEMLYDEPEMASDDRQELIRRVLANSRRLEGMVQDVLLASRIDVGKAQPRPRVIELHTKVAATIRDLGDIGAAVSNEILPGISVIADPEQLDRILFNLLSNAHKYGLPPVIVESRCVGEMIELSVLDHGQGVGPELRDRLFQRFEQGDSGPTRRSSGVGLGLHIVDGLARLNGGAVRYVEPAVGAGFIVSLPIAKALAVSA